jgi:hypothetical protein
MSTTADNKSINTMGGYLSFALPVPCFEVREGSLRPLGGRYRWRTNIDDENESRVGDLIHLCF